MTYFLEYRNNGHWVREPGPVHRHRSELPAYAEARASTLRRQVRIVEEVCTVICGAGQRRKADHASDR
jgi:hypothetical protein